MTWQELEQKRCSASVGVTVSQVVVLKWLKAVQLLKLGNYHHVWATTYLLTTSACALWEGPEGGRTLWPDHQSRTAGWRSHRVASLSACFES